MFTPLPRPPHGTPWPAPRVVILVIILAFIAVMAGFGYTPAVALGVVAAAAALVGEPQAARAALQA